MTAVTPVSIGLPVYNGDCYLAETLDSLLSQTYTDFTLIIADNASTDGTKEICREYARRDERIRYVRSPENLGAAANFNRAFRLSSSAYFKWAAHDDLCAPEYLERCVSVLDARPEVAVCHTLTSIIDRDGNYLRDYDDQLDFRVSLPHERFRTYLLRKAREWNAIFGVMRAEVLARTPLMGRYASADQVLLGELILRGALYQVPERLFFRRDHPENHWRANPTSRDRAVWFDPSNRGRRQLPVTWKHYWEYLRATRRAQLDSSNTIRCFLTLQKWLAKQLAWPVQRRWRAFAAQRSVGTEGGQVT